MTAISKLPDVYKRILIAAGVLTFVVIGGTASYHQVGAGRWSYFDCFYMTVITLSTVGFGETLPGMGTVHEARLITLALIVAGSGTLLYFISNLTALIVEGDLQGLLRRRRMERTIEHIHNHVIVCGIGATRYELPTRRIGEPVFARTEPEAAQKEQPGQTSSELIHTAPPE